jgi:predicted Holliday junction resolvase-like endonuclease
VFHHIHVLPHAVVMASVEHMTCVHREAVLQSKELIMASVSEHIQNEFAKWQEQQRQRDVITTVSSRMVWFDFLTFRTLMKIGLIFN